MKKFKLFLTAILLMLLGCTNGNGGGNGKEPDGNEKGDCFAGYDQMGSLQDRGGQYVTEENMNEVITMLMTELQMAFPFLEEEVNRPPEVILGNKEENRTEEHINGQEIRAWSYEYFDFSRTDGRLFIGGGVLINETREEDEGEQNVWLEENRCIKIKFNGMFRGELEIRSTVEMTLSNGCENVAWTNILIKINNKDVTDKFMQNDFLSEETVCR